MTSGAGEPPSVERWAGDAAVDESARSRAHRRHLRDAARGDATFVAALTDLAERSATVTVTTLHGSSHTGEICSVGADSITMSTPAARAVLIRRDRVASIRSSATTPPLARNTPPPTWSLVDALTELAIDRQRVRIRSGSAAPVVGDVEVAGLDVVTVVLDGGSRALVPLTAIWEVVVPR